MIRAWPRIARQGGGARGKLFESCGHTEQWVSRSSKTFSSLELFHAMETSAMSPIEFAILCSPAPGRFSACSWTRWSFGPSTVRVNTETVYSGRREAGVVMTSTGNVWILASGLSDRATLDRRYCPPNVVAANAQ
jgi:hypothetical protein